MTRNTNARVAGVTFLVYIAAGIGSLMLSGRATSGTGMAAKFATIAEHTGDMRAIVALTTLTSLCAIVLGVTLYAITRDEDGDLAMLAMIFRVIEGVNGVIGIPATLGLLWLATAAGPTAPDTTAAHALAAFLLHAGNPLGAFFFAIASTIFCWLFLRGQMIPAWLAWLGVLGSLLVVIGIPAQFVMSASSFGSVLGWLMWMPLLVFELTLAVLFLIKGVAAPRVRTSTG